MSRQLRIYEFFYVSHTDGEIIVESPKFQENLVCVVDNGFFAAAGYAYDEKEFECFNSDDGRDKTWLVYPFASELTQ